MSAVRTVAVMTNDSSTLSTRQRLALTRGNADAASALAMADSEIDALYLIRKRVATSDLRAARLTPLDLKQRGLETAVGLRELGFDSLDLVDSSFCASAVSAFGAESVRSAFLLDAGDAVAVAGSVAIFQLGITMVRLVELCAGAPEQAKAVLQQSEPRGGALQGVTANALLDTGLRAATLCELGYYLQNVQAQTKATQNELRQLGFV